MVAETQQAVAAPASSSTAVPSAEEEALKRNTDCVYFLASPLTCKKGSECEYRHSEYARVNPRDCWYWLNGNCLNPKCAFRHPPLDGLFGAQVPTSAGITSPAQQISVPSSSHNSSTNPSRKAVPCVFFQKGHCLRGDKCSFLHGTNSSGNKVQQPTPATSSGDLLTSKKPASTLKICSQEHQVPAHFSKPSGQQSSAKLLLGAEKNAPRKVGVVQESSLAIDADEELPLGRSSHPPSSHLQSKSGQSHQTHAFPEQNFQNDKETDDFMRESSPGFDVLVDDELRDPEFYHGEDQFGRTGSREGRLSSSMNECDLDHPTDYNSLSVYDREQLHDHRIYDSYDQISRQHGWEELQDLSEMVLGRRSHREGRSRVNGDDPEFFRGSDLRLRLSKQRRVNGLRSVVGSAFIPDHHVEEPNYQGSPQRDSQHPSSNGGSLSGRLRGRVKFPGRSVDKPAWEMDGGRSSGRLHQGRVSDRLKGRLQEENSGAFRRSSSGPRARREVWDENNANFAGPKSLAELKSTGQQGKGRESTLVSRQEDANLGDPQHDANPSFDGPQPLSVLLKRKREANTVCTEGSIQLVNGGATTERTEVELIDGTGDIQRGTCGDQSYVFDDANPSEIKEDNMAVQDVTGEHELEGDDQQDGGYYYEDEGEYNYDGDNADEAYVDEEDGDEFDKKVDVILT